MKSPDDTATTRHPPLAHDADGHPIAMPDGAAFWMLKRQTTGRPKVILGPDRRPLRLPLDTTEDEIADAYGSGTYRLDALDALGNPLDHVTTLSIGDDVTRNDDEGERNLVYVGSARGASSDLRAALDTIAQMARAQSSSLNAVATAQADWVKGLASARALPRNAMYAAPQPQLPEAPDAHMDDEETDDQEPEPLPPYAVVAQAANGIFQNLPAAMHQFSQMISSIAALRNAATAPMRHEKAASSPNPMVHLSEINERLTGPERRFLSHVLRSQTADTVTRELLARSVDDAVALIKDAIAKARAPRDAAADPAPASPPPADFTSHVTAVAMLLLPDERARVMSLVPRLRPTRMEELKSQLLAMTVDDAVAWIRQNLAALEAEVAT